MENEKQDSSRSSSADNGRISSQERDPLNDRNSPASRENLTAVTADSSHDIDINDIDQLGNALSKSLNLSKAKSAPLLLCDMGYGLPREERPRKERLNAIAKQLVNFLLWQTSAANAPKATLKVVACPDPDALSSRLQELWSEKSLPSHVSISEHPLGRFVQDTAIYLSPDAPRALDPHRPPPRVIIVGMLIDRRVQPNRSRQRAEKMELSLARWPALVGWDPQEPFNVDCILEGMQQWHWNFSDGTGGFLEAAQQALCHHQDRHPQRVQHIPIGIPDTP